MKSFMSVARRSAVLTVAALSAITLTACSAGQITQTDTQVAAVNGAEINTSAEGLVLRDATVIVDENNKASLKFTVLNNDPKTKAHKLLSVLVDGKSVDVPEDLTVAAGGTLVVAPKSALETMPKSDSKVVSYGTIDLENTGFAHGGAVDMEVNFDSASAKGEIPVAASHLTSGEYTRAVDEK